ncbi:MAG: O-antigen ligase family protein [Clostridia bacterium]|nr:O-antigen ligase family protein [Clostridia bacterium]MDD4386658.1 O-antigen ligase family protein [Clostridia bacterium]
MAKIDISKSFKLSIDIIVCFLILIQSIKKGGFYTSDITFFISSIAILGAGYGLFFIIKYFIDRYKKKCKKFSISNVRSMVILFALLAIAYMLPILFNTYANITDSKFEFVRYVSIFILYIIISNSVNKNLYYYTLISIGLIQAFVGIDGLASRILQPYLKLINSGYLSKDLTRLSGTIQYANTAAILIAVSGILILDKINTYIKKVKEDNTKLNNLGLVIYFTLFTISTLSIILTGSRMVLVIYIITLILYLLKTSSNKFNILIVLSTSYIISFLCSNNILVLVLTNPSRIYFVFLTYIILSVIAIRSIIKYIILNESLTNKINKIKLNKTKIIIICISTLIIYILIGLSVYKPLEIVKNEKDNTITRQIYGVKNNEINNIEISIKENESNSKYSIVVYEENDEFEQEQITRFEYYANVSNNFNSSFTPKANTKRLNIEFICYEGSIDITQFKLNGDVKPLEYSMLPSDSVFRFKDSFYGSTSSRDRFEYIKDGYKIWITSPIFGTGGEGFKYLYKNVQTLKYVSTEVHNSILQIFIESGIIGGISICLIIYFVIKYNKFSALKLCFIMYILHSLTDLNFSYLICLIVFSMLIGIIENKSETRKIIKQ